jgi:hypothetical protein
MCNNIIIAINIKYKLYNDILHAAGVLARKTANNNVITGKIGSLYGELSSYVDKDAIVDDYHPLLNKQRG